MSKVFFCFDQTLHLDRPWPGLQLPCVLRGIALLDAKLVEVVVMRDVLEGGEGQPGRGVLALNRRQLLFRRFCARWLQQAGRCFSGDGRQSGCRSRGHELPPIHVCLFRRDLRRWNVACGSNEHDPYSTSPLIRRTSGRPGVKFRPVPLGCAPIDSYASSARTDCRNNPSDRFRT